MPHDLLHCPQGDQSLTRQSRGGPVTCQVSGQWAASNKKEETEEVEIICATVIHDPVPGSHEETTKELRSIGYNLEQNSGVQYKIDKDNVLKNVLG